VVKSISRCVGFWFALTFVSPEALDTTGDVLATKEKVPAKGVVAAVGSLQQEVETLQVQDYKDASMYYGAYPAYAYGAYGGWGDYSTYLSHEGAQTPTSVSESSLFDILFGGPKDLIVMCLVLRMHSD